VKSKKMVRAGKKSWVTRKKNLASKLKRKKDGKVLRRKKVPKRVVGFYTEHGKTKPITKPEGELNRTRVIEEPSSFKAVRPGRGFKFEPVDFTWKDDQTRVIERMRIRKEGAGLITHLRIEHLVPANKGDVFFKSLRTGIVEVANEHLALLGVSTFKEYYSVSESFTQPSSGDPLGGFVSGRIWEIANKKGFLDALETYRQKGWIQVPYVPSTRKEGKLSEAQIRSGAQVELEHTKDLKKARKIAIDHLRENPRYYDYLVEMEKRMKAGESP
jgi:hypothetical protein